MDPGKVAQQILPAALGAHCWFVNEWPDDQFPIQGELTPAYELEFSEDTI
jgi:hypothetical protein